MGKVNKLHKLVPCRSKCKKLSEEDFKDTALVWFKASDATIKKSFWALESRVRLEALGIDISKEEYYPAPTAQEILNKMGCFYVSMEGTCGDFSVHWITEENQSYWGHGKTPVIALYNCYMNYKRRT